MTRAKALALVALVALVAAAPAPARAETADARRAEAATRFDRGMALLAEGDNAGARAELERVQAIAPHPQVLYNLGLVYAALGRPVDAVRSFDLLLAAPGTLTAERLARARSTRAEQDLRVGRLDVTTSAPATIEADGVVVGQTPLAEPLALAAGTHVIGAVAPGYLPVRREIALAGQAKASLQLELQPTELRLAHLSVRATLPGADVLVDGQAVGRTPLPETVAVPPGRRAVELRRAGYRPSRQELTLDDGATAEMIFELTEDDGARAKQGWLALAVSEPDPEVTVDGRPRGAYREPLALAPGAHDVRVARAGFLTAERTIVVPEASQTTAHVTLAPTPETRATYKHRATVVRRLGWSGALGGALLTGAGVALFALNRSALAKARSEYSSLDAMCSAAGTREAITACHAQGQPAADELNLRENLQTAGIIGLGVGVAAAAAGITLLLVGDDPNRYDRVARDPDQTLLGGWVAPGGGGLRLAGAF